MGVEALLDSIEMVRDGVAPSVPQDDSQATYEGWCLAENVVIDWDRPAREVYNLIRGGDPSPGAGTTFDGKKIQFYRAALTNVENGKAAGEVTEVSEEGFGVSAAGGTLWVRRVQPEGSGKIMAPEWAATIGLRPGARFGS